MALLPPNHSDRIALAAEAHARPPEPLETPSHATYIAVLVDHEKRAQELEHLATLCTHYGVAGPAATSTHFSAMLASVRVKWERHGEFSGYTFFTSGSSPEPFDGPPTDLLPQGWLAAVPGVTVAAAHAELLPAGLGVPDVDRLAAHFAGNIVVGAEIGDGAGLAYTDFRIHADGCARFLVLNRSLRSPTAWPRPAPRPQARQPPAGTKHCCTNSHGLPQKSRANSRPASTGLEPARPTLNW